jgi:hypothetical protein
MFLKDPESVLDYAVDWTARCAGVRTVVESDWRAEPAGLAVSGAVHGAERTEVRLGGGVPGLVYRVANLVRFSDGLADERSLVLRVEQR